MESERHDNLKQRGNAKGTTSAVVAQNVRRLRASRDLRSVSNHLRDVGWPISVAALSRLENGERRIDVDDLMALAIVLDVSPIRLLLPSAEEDGPTVATGMSPEVNPIEARAWAREEAGLSHQHRIDYWVDQQRLWGNEARYAEERPVSESLELRQIAERHRQRAREKAAEASARLDELLAKGGSID